MLRRSGRAALTVIAVALATTLLTGLLTIARTGETRVLDEIAKGGPLAGIKVEAARAVPGQLDSDTALSGAPHDIDERARRRIASLPGVASVVPVVVTPVFVLPGTAGRGATVAPFGETYVGVDLARVGKLPVSLLAGAFPAPGSRTEVAVTQGYLEPRRRHPGPGCRRRGRRARARGPARVRERAARPLDALDDRGRRRPGGGRGPGPRVARAGPPGASVDDGGRRGRHRTLRRVVVALQRAVRRREGPEPGGRRPGADHRHRLRDQCAREPDHRVPALPARGRDRARRHRAHRTGDRGARDLQHAARGGT